MFTRIVLLLRLSPLFVFSQNQDSTLSIPMKNGKICYERQFTDAGKRTPELKYKKAMSWLHAQFDGTTETALPAADTRYGEIRANGIFKIVTSDAGNYYWLKPVISISITDSSYAIRVTDFYEKPVEKGITNDYSKLEYRWYDYRKGKPWSPEDKPLFKGLVTQVEAMIRSFGQAMMQ